MTEGGEPQIGSLSEEALKLLSALEGWARESKGGDEWKNGGLLSYLNEHIATGDPDCQYCPVCQLIAAVRRTSPEVKHHLGTAVSSLLQAAIGVLATPPPGTRSDRESVERIDLDGAWEDD